MANSTLDDLQRRSDAASTNLTRQLAGMEPYMERADAPGEWTMRQVLSHLLFQPGWDSVTALSRFAEQDLPQIDIEPGQPYMTEERRRMTLAQFVDALGAQRRAVFTYLGGVPESGLTSRRARIPLFKQIMGTDEVPLAAYVGALFEYHWNDHAGQLAKIRKAVGLV